MVNASKRLVGHEAQVDLMCKAIDSQLRDDFCPAWGLVHWPFQFFADPKAVPTGAPQIDLKDVLATEDALGDHSETSRGRIVGEVGVNVIMDNGGTLLVGANSIAQTLAHEALELRGNPWANLEVRHPRTGYSYWREAGDPVENDSYQKSVNGQAVSVSNFVLLPWFDAFTTDPRVDFLGLLRRPFTMDAGGYMGRVDPEGNDATVYGRLMPRWRRLYKQRKGARMNLDGRAGSSGQKGLAPIARDMIERLEARGVDLGRFLAAEGRVIADAVESWPIAPPTDHERLKTCATMLDWHRRALDFLAGSR